MIGIGIDTGGTYTDAVVYDMDARQILASSKARTTRDDLKRGIAESLFAIPEDLLLRAGVLSLSTTLATNASIENKGGKGKLLLIGASRETFEETADEYGMSPKESVSFLDAQVTSDPQTSCEPDWNEFELEIPQLITNCDCIGIVQLFAKQHTGTYEEKAKAILEKHTQIPIILGHNLFPDLNVMRRGAGMLLNAKLVPVIYEFLNAVKEVLAEKGLELPILIVRSDGTLMTESFTRVRPVETLLCGPAASIMGAKELCKKQDALVIDMGGTTTDVAILHAGTPKLATEGVQVGTWKTFVKGMHVDTFGLGGDTVVHSNRGSIVLEKERVLPLCALAADEPAVLDQLYGLEPDDYTSHFPMYEFLTLQKQIPSETDYTEQECRLCRSLAKGPIMLKYLEERTGIDLYQLRTDRLEREGIVLRAGFTPTDVMHLRGDFTDFDVRASKIAETYLCAESGIGSESLRMQVYDLVEKRLYCNLVRILLSEKDPAYQDTPETRKLIEMAYEGEKNPLGMAFQTDKILVGLGGPAHLFVERVARRLGTRAVIPEHASVANAVGAIAGRVSATITVELTQQYQESMARQYRVIAGDGTRFFAEYEEAYAFARGKAEQLAREEAQRRGAQKIHAAVEAKRIEAHTDNGDLYMADEFTATAYGRTDGKNKKQQTEKDGLRIETKGKEKPQTDEDRMCDDFIESYDLEKIGIAQHGYVRADKIGFYEEVRKLCESNQCRCYGTTWACPPAVGTIEQCAGQIRTYTRGMVFSGVYPLEDSYDVEGMQKGLLDFKKTCDRLHDAVKDQYPNHLLLSNESCGRCDTCTYPEAPCRFPDQLFPSIEGYGIIVSELASQAQIRYMNGANTVTYIGMLLV